MKLSRWKSYKLAVMVSGLNKYINEMNNDNLSFFNICLEVLYTYIEDEETIIDWKTVNDSHEGYK